MQHAYEIDNRPFARVIFAAMLSLAMWLALIPNPVTAAPKLRDYATLEFPPCGGILFNIAIESMGDDRITESRCTFEMNEGEPTFKFEGNAICGQNSQVAFSGEAGLEPITVFHAHVTCSPDRDLVSVFDSRNCTDGMTYVVFIVNGNNAKNVDLACDFQSLNEPKIDLTPTDFAGICVTDCMSENFVENSLGSNWYLNASCNGTFTVPATTIIDDEANQLDLVWFDKEGLASRIVSGDENPTATGVCLAYLEPIVTI